MNALNKLVMLVIALLLIAVPAVLFLMATGIVSASLIDGYINYSAALDVLGNVSLAQPTVQLRLTLGVLCAVVCLLALMLILRELVIGRPLERSHLIDDTQGQEVKIKTQAVKALIEGAARHAGAVEADARLSSVKGRYLVDCRATLPQEANVSDAAASILSRIQDVLDGQGIGYRSVEVTVTETSSERSGLRREGASEREQRNLTRASHTESSDREQVTGTRN